MRSGEIVMLLVLYVVLGAITTFGLLPLLAENLFVNKPPEIVPSLQFLILLVWPMVWLVAATVVLWRLASVVVVSFIALARLIFGRRIPRATARRRAD